MAGVARRPIRCKPAVVVVPVAWTILQYPPETADADLQARLWRFSAYVSSTWISRSFPVSLWTHFDNDGPRTTNIAEGWHNSLISQFGVSHPSMRVFLDWLQKCQHATACRILQLTVGRPPKRQAVAYRRLDCRIREAKLRFGLSIGRIFAYIYPDPCSSEQMRVEMLQYLNHVAYLVMGTD